MPKNESNTETITIRRTLTATVLLLTALSGGLAPLTAAPRGRSDADAAGSAPRLAGPRRTVAVARFTAKSDFQAQYGLTDVGGGLAAMLTTALVESGQFLVVERPDLSSVFSEQELASHGLTTAESRAPAGQLIGAQLLLVGSVTELDLATAGGGFSIGFGRRGRGIGLSPQKRTGIVGIDVRVIDTTTAQVIASFHVRGEVTARSIGLQLTGAGVTLGNDQVQKTPLGAAARAAIDDVVRRFAAAAAARPWSGRVVDVEGSEVVINAGAESGLAPGDRFGIERITRLLTDPATGRVLGHRTLDLGTVVVESVEQGLAFARFEPLVDAPPQRNDLVVLR